MGMCVYKEINRQNIYHMIVTTHADYSIQLKLSANATNYPTAEKITKEAHNLTL